MEVLIVGAGGQGAPCASILARDVNISRIVLGDINLDLANRVKDRIGSGKITAVKLDAGSVEEIEKAAQGVDVIVNLTLIRFNDNVMQAALNSSAHYLDTALGDTLWNQLLEGESLFLDKEFKDAGLTALVGCGMTPGITNVLARYACDKLDRVDRIYVRAGFKPLDEELVREWDPGWAPEIALMDYAEPIPVLENGKLEEYAPFSGVEEYAFPAPVGPLVISHHAHEEAPLLGRFIGKGLKYCEFKYPLDPIAAALVLMGFAKREPIEVKGLRVAPIDVISAMVRQPVNAFFLETEETVQLPVPSVGALEIEVHGAKSDESVTYRLTKVFSPSSEEQMELFRRLGTAQIYVALPAAIGAGMCVQGVTKGVIAPECLDPIAFLKAMSDVGAPLSFTEECIKEVVIS
jgi:saccharopine dehydrogenase-like NADP-dependent oxidoreductase